MEELQETHLKQGDVAPDFEAIDERGNAISLKDFKGKKLVLYFYPKDNTPTCTVESCNLRDNYSELLKAGFEVVGVSPDSPKRHQNFIGKFKLPFRLIADEDRRVMNDYGVWGKKRFMGRVFDGVVRTTFVIDEEGKVERVFKKVKSKVHTKQILESYN